MMCEFLEFGRYFAVKDNLFLAEVQEGGERVELTSVLGTPKWVHGDDARQFVAMARARVRACPFVLPTAAPAADEPRADAPPEPPEDGTRGAPAEAPSIVSATPLHAPRPTAESLRPPAQGRG